MSGPRFSYVPVMDHEIHVTEWGDPKAPPLVMWHGLARTGRDFDELGAALSDEYFVICPDTIGRGLSSWAETPEVEYSIEYYTGVAMDLLDHYRLERADWFGTSMGGLIGMRIASGPQADRLTGLILNDIGPEVPQAAVERILAYAGDPPKFDRLSEAEAWLRAVYAPFGAAPDGFWRRMARTSVRRIEGGGFTLHYDPRIVAQFAGPATAAEDWERYARIRTPTHVIRGENSDILTAEILDRMRGCGPRPEATVMAGCGHAPCLAGADGAALLRRTLRALRRVMV